MANLVKCEDCQKKVSINADSCPKCGSLIQQQTAVINAKNKIEKDKLAAEKNQKTLLYLLVFGLVVFGIMGIKSSIFGSILILISAALIFPITRNIIQNKYIRRSEILNLLAVITGVVGFVITGTAAKQANEKFLSENPEIAIELANKAKEKSILEAEQKRIRDQEMVTSRGVLLVSCSNIVKASLKNPRSFDLEHSTVEYGSRDDGFAIKFNYYAKNSFGADLLGRADCSYDAQGKILDWIVE